MPIFECSKCHGIDNTALCHYWGRGENPALCSECDTEIGEWHGKFPKESADKYEPDGHGFLKRKD